MEHAFKKIIAKPKARNMHYLHLPNIGKMPWIEKALLEIF